MSESHCTHPPGGLLIRLKQKKNLHDAGQASKHIVQGRFTRVGLGNFLYLLAVPKVVCVMDVCVKPACSDSVPPCLCKKCQMYDVKMSSRSVAKPNPSTLWSSESTVAESTFGLCDVWGVCDAKRLCCEDTAETDSP